MTAATATLRYSPTPAGVSHYEEREGGFPSIPLAPTTDAATNQYADRGFAHHFAKLESVMKDHTLWPEGANAPASHTQVFALAMLDLLKNQDFSPTRIVASAEGGIAICFVKGDKYADVEFLNTGEILGVQSDRRSRPVAWEIDQNARDFTRAAVWIREFFEASPPAANAARWPWRR